MTAPKFVSVPVTLQRQPIEVFECVLNRGLEHLSPDSRSVLMDEAEKHYGRIIAMLAAAPAEPAAVVPHDVWVAARRQVTYGYVHDDPNEKMARFILSLAAAPASAEDSGAQAGPTLLTFRAFRAANVARCLKWHPAGIASWSPSDWLTAVTGELGELASLLKMRNRERDGLPGNKFSPTKKQIADEIADVLTYLDLLAEVLEIDLGLAAVEKFNEVSERVGFPDRITLTPPPSLPEERVREIRKILRAAFNKFTPGSCHVLSGKCDCLLCIADEISAALSEGGRAMTAPDLTALIRRLRERAAERCRAAIFADPPLKPEMFVEWEAADALERLEDAEADALRLHKDKCDALEKLHALERLAGQNPPSDAPRWIPVAERLPEKGHEVYVAGQTVYLHHVSNWQCKAIRYETLGWKQTDWSGQPGVTIEPTHWMPLPEPPHSAPGDGGK